MKTTDEHGKQIKVASLSEKRIEYYLGRVGAKSLDFLEFEQRKRIFLLAIKDFMDGILSSDELSSISFDLNDWKADPKSFNEDETELHHTTLAGSELAFYIRKIDSDESVSQFDIFMYEIMKYFAKHFPF